MTRTEAERLTRIEVLLEAAVVQRNEDREAMKATIEEMASDIKQIKADLAALLPIEHEVVYPLTVWAALVTVDAFSRKIGAIDYGGHGAEIMAAEKAGFLGYREAEIARMSDDGDKIGHNVAARLLRWEWLSRIVYALGR